MENSQEIKLKYEFTEDEVSYLLNAVNNQNPSEIQHKMIEESKMVLHIVNLLKSPLNLNELKKKDRRKPNNTG